MHDGNGQEERWKDESQRGVTVFQRLRPYGSVIVRHAVPALWAIANVTHGCTSNPLPAPITLLGRDRFLYIRPYWLFAVY